MIVLHAGHGKRANGRKDPGAVGPTGLTEHEVVADIVSRVGHLLRAAGVQVQEYTNHPSGEAVRAANAQRADLAVFVHCNAATGTAKGTETWWYTAWGRRVAAAVQSRIVQYLRTPGGWYLPAYPDADRGLKEAVASSRAGNVIRGVRGGAILVETLFIDNPTEEALLRLPTVRQEIAQAITDGILAAATGSR
jgi:N-acetylmuramoyl-L-alanine amidase